MYKRVTLYNYTNIVGDFPSLNVFKSHIMHFSSQGLLVKLR